MIDIRRSAFTPIQGFLHGFVSGGGSNGLVLDRMIVVAPAQIRYVLAAAQSGGASPTILDVQIGTQSVWTNPADRPTLAPSTFGKFISGRINRTAVKAGDVLTLLVAVAGGGASITATVALEDPSQAG